MEQERKWASVLVGCLAILANSPIGAAERCDYVFRAPNIGDGAIIDLTNSMVVGPGYTLPTRARSISLGYIVPQTGYVTGVLIVKSRHKVVTSSRSNAANTISVERSGYTSPCSKGDVAAYSHDVDVERYIDYHFYGLRDSEQNRLLNLEFAHADVGPRQIPRAWPLPPRARCLNTRYGTIRVQFLYSDDRRVAYTLETLSRQYSLFSRAVGPSPAYAAPAAYREYDSLKTIVIPYVKRSAGARSCFAFKLPIPKDTVTTEVMIVDADQAFANSGIDPQQSWTLSWPPPGPVR